MLAADCEAGAETMLTDPVKRIAAAVVAGMIYRAVEDEFEMGNISHLVGLGPCDMAEIENRLLILANRFDDQSGLPERRAEWRDVLFSVDLTNCS